MFSKSANYYWDSIAVQKKAECDRMRGPALDPCQDNNGNSGLSHRPIGTTRNFRQSDLFMDSAKGLLLDDEGDPLAVVTSSEALKAAHYAAFPPKLVEPFVLAAVPKKCCPKCGAGWRRVVEKHRTFESGSGKSGRMPIGKNGPGFQGGGETLDVRRGPVVHTKTTGWHPGCECGESDTIPGTLLDPFSGAGSGAIACLRHGRRFIGIELSAEYVALSKRRIAKAMRPGTAKPLVAVDEDFPLFCVEADV